jgi:8-oxo-dGTP pyrophosphatase MutT (NUDIX family)
VYEAASREAMEEAGVKGNIDVIIHLFSHLLPCPSIWVL